MSSLPQNIHADYRLGRKLYGDDFTETQLEKWLGEEEDAFFSARIDAERNPEYRLIRMMNQHVAFRRILQVKQTGTMLVLGPAGGLDIKPFADAGSWEFIFVEAAAGYRQALQARFPGARVLPPSASGRIAVEAAAADAVCCFSVLHHIANVSTVLKELHRILRRQGVIAIREPSSSMGDWRKARSATPNERGIPRKWMVDRLTRTGFALIEPPVPFQLNAVHKLLHVTRLARVMPTRTYMLADLLMCRLLQWNDRYWRDRPWKKIAPAGYFYCASKL